MLASGITFKNLRYVPHLGTTMHKTLINVNVSSPKSTKNQLYTTCLCAVCNITIFSLIFSQSDSVLKIGFNKRN